MDKKTLLGKVIFGMVLIILGAVLNFFNLGTTNFQIYGSVGNWLIFIGIFVLALNFALQLRKKKQVKDERMQNAALKASHVAFLAMFLGAFLVIIVDGINTITMPYHIFMGHFVSWVLLVYVVAYYIILKRN
jgi:drug/metabolite transporter (DMT)-like permease